MAGGEIALPAPLIRSRSLDVRGFSVAHPPLELKRDAYLRLTEHAARRRHRRRRRPRARSTTSPARGSASARPPAARRPSSSRDPTRRSPVSANAPTPEPGRPIVFRRGTVLTMNDAHEIARGRRRARRRRSHRGGRARAGGPGGDVRDRRRRRHRHAGHDRHAPAHVADRDARLRRRLDAEPVLRLLLPRVRQDLPPAGHPRRQPAVGDRVARRRRHHDRRLVARPADDRPRGRGGRRAARRCPAASCSPTATSSRARGSGRPSPDFKRFVDRRFGGGGDMLGFQMAFDVTGDPEFPEKAAFEVGARARRAGDHARRRVGRDQRRRHPAHARARLHDAREHLRARRDARPRTPTTASPRPAARCRCRPRASRAPARATRRPGSCASTTSPSRCRWTRACGGAATCSRRCAARSAPTARASTSRRTRSRRRSPTTTCAPSTSSTGPPAAAAGRCGWTRSIGSLEAGKKADVVLIKNDALAGHVPAAAPLRARRLPGPARRRPHRPRRRPRGQALPTGSSASTSPPRGGRSRRRSSSRCASSATTRGPPACTRRSPRPRCSHNPYTYTEWDAGTAQWKRSEEEAT